MTSERAGYLRTVGDVTFNPAGGPYFTGDAVVIEKREITDAPTSRPGDDGGRRLVRRYYHGTTSVLAVGDVLIPGEQRGVNNFEGADNSVVWLHDNPAAAASYGPRVYEVEPQEWVENFSEDAGHIEEGLSEGEWEYVTPAARVIGCLA